jgi:hypothetical protein
MRCLQLLLPTDGASLWHVAPGFAGSSWPVTVVCTSNEQFLESMRLFGVPQAHQCRLEAYSGLLTPAGGSFRGPNRAHHMPFVVDTPADWVIRLTGKSFLGVPRDRDAVGRTHCLSPPITFVTRRTIPRF